MAIGDWYGHCCRLFDYHCNTVAMKIGIMTYEQFANQPRGSAGSTRIRSEWILPFFPEAEEFRIGTKYDAVIYQKAYFLEHMAAFEGVKILDLCDPDWLENKPVVQAIELCDAVTVSSEALAEYLRKVTDKPVVVVHDRINPDAFPQKKRHEGIAKGVVWFGYNHNQQVLDAVLPALKRLGLDLTVISDLPYIGPTAAIQGIDRQWVNMHVKNVKFDWETLPDEMIYGGDFVLNNRPDFGKFVYKSENKTVIAWALGMPVAKTVEDVERFMDAGERTKEAQDRLAEVELMWTSDITVSEYREVIRDCASKSHAA